MLLVHVVAGMSISQSKLVMKCSSLGALVAQRLALASLLLGDLSLNPRFAIL